MLSVDGLGQFCYLMNRLFIFVNSLLCLLEDEFQSYVQNSSSVCLPQVVQCPGGGGATCKRDSRRPQVTMELSFPRLRWSDLCRALQSGRWWSQYQDSVPSVPPGACISPPGLAPRLLPVLSLCCGEWVGSQLQQYEDLRPQEPLF